MLAHVKFADFNDPDSVKRLITKNTCAIFMETVQGESGIYPTTEYFIKGVRKLCDENKILMVLDEIQCGMGRSGNMFAYQLYDVAPDIVVSAKALGCGIPVGALEPEGQQPVYCVQEIMAQLTAPILWPLQPLLLYSSFINSITYWRMSGL